MWQIDSYIVRTRSGTIDGGIMNQTVYKVVDRVKGCTTAGLKLQNCKKVPVANNSGFDDCNFREATSGEIEAFKAGFPTVEAYKIRPLELESVAPYIPPIQLFPKDGAIFCLLHHEQEQLLEVLKNLGKKNTGSMSCTGNLAWGMTGYWWVEKDTAKPIFTFSQLFPGWHKDGETILLPSFVNVKQAGYVRVTTEQRAPIESYFNSLGYVKNVHDTGNVFAFYPSSPRGGKYQYLSSESGITYQFSQFFPNFTNNKTNDTQTKMDERQGCLGGRIIRIPSGRSQITSSKRLVGNKARGKKIGRGIVTRKLSYSILSS